MNASQLHRILQQLNAADVSQLELVERYARDAIHASKRSKYGNPADHLDESDYCRTHDLFASLFGGECPYC